MNAQRLNSKRLSHTEHEVLRTIIMHEGISRAQLAHQLDLSMPTIASALKRLHELRYVTQLRGALDSTGGRRSDAYAFAYSRCICVGVLVRKGTAHLVSTNLRGDVGAHHSVSLDSFGASDFYDGLALAIESFIDSSQIDTRHLRGIGVTVASHAALDEQSESRLRMTIESRLSYPVRIMREPFALAAAETLFNPTITDALCLYLNATMSSAFIRNGRYMRTPVFAEHTRLYPTDTSSATLTASASSRNSSQWCECGHYGCAQLYCSSQSLLTASGIHDTHVREFIDHMRDGDYTHAKVFSTYMDSLALLIHNIQMIVNVPVILGGDVARYLDSSDLSDIRSRVRSLAPRILTPAPDKRTSGHDNTVFKSHCTPDQAIIGAAYVLAQDYLDSLLSA
ncbi:ROK family protein [Alloscardovia omnicolens]|uniref:ROK family transcriptional regulator n=1 Tax=Alloscardovia omnicolens TaxID=419015 RepID=UPI003A70CC4D